MSPLLTVPLGNECNEVDVTTTNSTVVQDIQNIDIIDIVDFKLDIDNQNV